MIIIFLFVHSLSAPPHTHTYIHNTNNTGSVGAFIANPIDVLKVRLMASTTPEPILAAAGASAAGNGNRSATIMSNSSSATVYGYGGASSFSSSAAAATVSPRHGSGAQVVPGRRSLRKEFKLVTQRNGFGALYAGLLPSIMRGAMVTVGGLATYDQCKTSIKQYLGVPEGTALHTVSSLITGVVATTVAAPLDVIKTRWGIVSLYITCACVCHMLFYFDPYFF